MQQAITHIGIDTRGSGLVEFTSQVRAFVDQHAISTGLLTVFCRHTSASLLIQENADASVQRDIERYFATLAPEDATRYEHDTEGTDDMPAHLRTALTQVQLSIPVEQGRMVLGTAGDLPVRASPRAPPRYRAAPDRRVSGNQRNKRQRAATSGASPAHRLRRAADERAEFAQVDGLRQECVEYLLVLAQRRRFICADAEDRRMPAIVVGTATVRMRRAT